MLGKVLGLRKTGGLLSQRTQVEDVESLSVGNSIDLFNSWARNFYKFANEISFNLRDARMCHIFKLHYQEKNAEKDSSWIVEQTAFT